MQRILVIEDDRSIRETLGMVLECYEYQADLVESGEAALKFLENQWPDAILLDLTLAGMSGEEVYRRIERRFGSVPPTIVLSAVPEGPSKVQHLAGVRFLAKPYTLDQLADALRSAIRARKAA